MRRVLVALAAGALLLSGCAADGARYQAATARALQQQVLAVAESAADGEHEAALTRLDELTASTKDARVRGTVTEARHDSIMSAIDLVRADLEALLAAAPEKEEPTAEEPATDTGGGGTGGSGGGSGDSGNGDSGSEGGDSGKEDSEDTKEDKPEKPTPEPTPVPTATPAPTTKPAPTATPPATTPPADEDVEPEEVEEEEE